MTIDDEDEYDALKEGTCATCKYGVLRPTPLPPFDPPINCHRYPTQVRKWTYQWCGEHARKET